MCHQPFPVTNSLPRSFLAGLDVNAVNVGRKVKNGAALQSETQEAPERARGGSRRGKLRLPPSRHLRAVCVNNQSTLLGCKKCHTAVGGVFLPLNHIKSAALPLKPASQLRLRPPAVTPRPPRWVSAHPGAHMSHPQSY